MQLVENSTLALAPEIPYHLLLGDHIKATRSDIPCVFSFCPDRIRLKKTTEFLGWFRFAAKRKTTLGKEWKTADPPVVGAKSRHVAVQALRIFSLQNDWYVLEGK